MPIFLYGCEMCPLTLREGHRLKVYKNRVCRNISGHKSEKIIGG